MSDLIERQAAIRWVKTECNPYGKPTLDFESGKKVIEHLEQMPSVQPESKTAHWKTHIFDGIMGGRPRAYMCGYCNFISLARTNYCPNCGADMRGEQNDDNGTD